MKGCFPLETLHCLPEVFSVWRDFEKAVLDFLEGPCQYVKCLERGGEIISPFIHSLVNEAVNLFQAFEKMFCSPLYEFHDFKGRAHLIWQNGRSMLDFFMRTDMKICFFQVNYSLISLWLKSPAQFLWKFFSVKVKGGRSWWGWVLNERVDGESLLEGELHILDFINLDYKC